MLEDCDFVFEILEPFLERIPTLDRHQDREGLAPLGDHERVVAEVAELTPDPVAEASLWNDPSGHSPSVR